MKGKDKVGWTYRILSYPILFCPILSYPVLSCPVQFKSAPSELPSLFFWVFISYLSSPCTFILSFFLSLLHGVV